MCCRTIVQIGFQWFVSKCRRNIIEEVSHERLQTNAVDSGMYAAAVDGER